MLLLIGFWYTSISTIYIYFLCSFCLRVTMTLFWLGILNSACGVGKPVAFWKIERYSAGLYRRDKLLVTGSLYSHQWLQKKTNHKIRIIFRNIKVVLFFLSFPFPFWLCLACWREIEIFRLQPKGTGAKTFAMVTWYNAPSCTCLKVITGAKFEWCHCFIVRDILEFFIHLLAEPLMTSSIC